MLDSILYSIASISMLLAVYLVVLEIVHAAICLRRGTGKVAVRYMGISIVYIVGYFAFIY